MDDNSDDAFEKEAVAFLARDFTECFEERRRCEDRSWDITKFTFTAYSAIVAVALGAHEYGLAIGADFRTPTALLLTLAATVGLFDFFLMIRTRVYFVLVTRYINEQRHHFLKSRPLGFQNSTKLYTDPSLPPYASSGSTQTWAALLVAALNGVLLGLAWWLVGGSPVLAAALIFVLQSAFGLGYLRRREGKSADAAVHGKK